MHNELMMAYTLNPQMNDWILQRMVVSNELGPLLLTRFNFNPDVDK